jgi:hypothetical protein
MSESGELRSTLRVVRTVRRGSFVGGRISRETGGGGDPASSLATAALALAVTGAEIPLLAPILAATLALGIISQYSQPGLGAYGLSGFVLPDNVLRPWEYADKVRRLTLEKVYGSEEGNKIWTAEWNQRAIDIDLRVRMP